MASIKMESTSPLSKEYSPTRKRKTTGDEARSLRAKRQMNRATFPFMKLPGEIRNIIYGYALIDTDSIIAIEALHGGKLARRLMTKKDFDHRHRDLDIVEYQREILALNPGTAWKWKLNNRIAAQLLLVCKNINEEATKILYVRNHFTFINAEIMYIFLRRIGPRIQDLRRLSLVHWDASRQKDYLKLVFNKLIEATNLEALILETGCMWSLGSTYYSLGFQAANRFYSSAHGWLWTVATRKGDKAAALDLLHLPDGFERAFHARTQQLPYFRKYPARFCDAQSFPSIETNFVTTIRKFMD
ncbi:hypothetical protein CC78DRAFT_531093 [Lojkania enalia]|uniref:DUF7730 domain-containing protein n=1 Tax=Lojkania enalia TaxID=147567 RepID=A0A9P4KF38_9PLEO|nr:hypothetical protein CC78DRAFT_531093 [Didymosphaeria enalia]